MASTNKTTNYELSQFVETDRPAWLTDYNGDMRTIDSAMKAISDVASGASGSISELADRMSTAEGNISTNTNDIATLDARADALEAGAQSQAGTIAGIQTEQITQNAGIEAATELGYNLARPYDSASTYAVGAYVLFQNTLYKCVTAIATGEAFDPTKWLAIKATDEIAAGGYTLPIASASQLGGFKVGNNLSIDPVTGVLSAIGGSSNLIVLNSTNTTLSFDDSQPPSYRKWQNYFYGAPTPVSQTTLTNPRIAFTDLIDQSFYFETGDLKLLKLGLNLLFDPVTTENNNVAKFDFRFKIQNANIPALPRSPHAFCEVTGGSGDPLQTYFYYDTISGDYVIVSNLYRPQGGPISGVSFNAMIVFH